MLTKRKLIIISICIILVASAVAVYFILHNSPMNFIESKLKFNLPKESKIINYRQHGNFIKAKVLIKRESINDLKENLKNTIKSYPVKDAEDMTITKNSVPWWDLDNRDIEDMYMKWVDEDKLFDYPEPHQLWAVISKNKDGQYYLYLSY